MRVLRRYPKGSLEVQAYLPGQPLFSDRQQVGGDWLAGLPWSAATLLDFMGLGFYIISSSSRQEARNIGIVAKRDIEAVPSR
jgi:hypothetical protein